MAVAQNDNSNTNKQPDFTYDNTVNSTKKLDTLRTYNVDLYETSTPFGIKYTANGKEITKKQYDEFKWYWTSVDACTPCQLRTFDEENNLMYEAFQYENCLCGDYVSYYKDGSKKVIGQFMPNPTTSWENIKQQNFCNRKTGAWKYFLPNGTIEKVEEYKNGVLVNVSKGNSELMPSENKSFKFRKNVVNKK